MHRTDAIKLYDEHVQETGHFDVQVISIVIAQHLSDNNDYLQITLLCLFDIAALLPIIFNLSRYISFIT